MNKSIFGKLNEEPNWYALKTRSRHEKKVNERLLQKGITCYLPLYTTYRKWSDRRKKVTEPLFTCYLFVRIPLKDRLDVLQTDGVVNLVSFKGIPAPIPEHQIDSVRMVLNELDTVERADYLTAGEEVEVIHGPLRGVTGTFQRIKDQSRLVISIEAIHQAISVEIDAHLVKPVNSKEQFVL